MGGGNGRVGVSNILGVMVVMVHHYVGVLTRARQTEAVRTLGSYASWNLGGSWPDRDTNWSYQVTQLDDCVRFFGCTLGRVG